MTTGKTAVQEASELARQLGDEAWGQGRTKRALEAWEASDVPPEELLEKAKALLQAIEVNKKWSEELDEVKSLNDPNDPITHNTLPSPPCICERCRYAAVEKRYYDELRKLLGWDEGAPIGHNVASLSSRSDFYLSAAIACFRTIKRMDAANQ